MSGLKHFVKDNVISNQYRYYESQENLGQVIATDPEKQTCDIVYKNRDNTMMTARDVKVYMDQSLKTGFPAIGNLVKLKEHDQSVVILGIEQHNDAKSDTSTASDKYSFSNDNMGGFIG